MVENVYKAPETIEEAATVFCRDCGEKLKITAKVCGNCGAEQELGGKSKIVAGLLAIFLGAFGVHRFYLKQWWGLFYLLLFWTGIPGIVAFIEGIVFFCTSHNSWNKKYGAIKGGSVGLIIIGGFVFVMIIGIVAAVALPAYQEYVERAEQAALK